MNSAWQEVELQDIANFQNGYAFKSDEYVPCSSNGKEVLRMDTSRGEVDSRKMANLCMPR
jgi:hypothetical protein